MGNPTPTFGNHASAENYPEDINTYIQKELSRGAVCGAFDEIPFLFTSRIGVSPLSTRPKKDSVEHRIIMDLSWPPGRSVNNGIAKDQFMGFHAKLSFPTIDAIVRRVVELGDQEPVYLFKVDLSAYFRQLPLDPGDYSLLCFVWNGKIYFDIVSPMGLHSAPYFAQCTSNAIRHMHNVMGYFLFNYIDDLIGIERNSKIEDSFDTLQRTLRDIGLKQSESKRVQPTQVLNCVGTLVYAKEGTLSILPDRKEELLGEISELKCKKSCSIKDLQRLIGKLQFVCTVVRLGRLFMSCMLELLCNTTGDRIRISGEFAKDLEWWEKYLPGFKGTSILWMYQVCTPDKIAASDACLSGMGSVADNEYCKAEFPLKCVSVNIAHLELLAIVVMCKIWIKKFAGKAVTFNCDNEAVVQVVNTGRAHDSRLLELMRELVFVAAGHFEFRATHLMGKLNKLPDLLSRWKEGEKIHKKFFNAIDGKGMYEIAVAPDVFELKHTW